QGKLAAAESTVALMNASMPRNPATALIRATMMNLRGHRDSAVVVLDSLRRARPGDLDIESETAFRLSAIAVTRGRLSDGTRWLRQATEAATSMGSRGAPLSLLLSLAEADLWFREKPALAVTEVDRALVEQPLDSLPAAERPFDRLAS